MDYADALEAISKLENGAALVDSVRAKVTALNQENGSWRTKLRESQEELKRIQELAGEDGKSVEAKFQELSSTLAALTQERDQFKAVAESATVAKTEAENQLLSTKKSLHFQQAAAKAGADYDALSKLLSELSPDAVKIQDDGVSIVSESGELPLAEYAQQQGDWVARAIFPTAPGTRPQARLPQGGPSGKTQERNPVKSAVDKMKFAVPGS